MQPIECGSMIVNYFDIRLKRIIIHLLRLFCRATKFASSPSVLWNAYLARPDLEMLVFSNGRPVYNMWLTLWTITNKLHYFLSTNMLCFFHIHITSPVIVCQRKHIVLSKNDTIYTFNCALKKAVAVEVDFSRSNYKLNMYILYYKLQIES